MSTKNVLYIGKTYIIRKEKFSYLSADITIDNHGITLWFAVDTLQEDCLSIGRSDAFVMALLPMAMRKNYDIVCEDLISERLMYQLNNYLIPILSLSGDLYSQIRVYGPYTRMLYSGRSAVGTGFSGGVDSLYTIMRHDKESEYPLDYIAVFNTGNIESGFGKKAYWESCKAAARFADEQNLQIICVDTNLYEALPEHYYQIYSFRNIACALALQGLFSIYLLSSEGGMESFRLNLNICSRYDLLTINYASTESLCFYLSGAEKKRWEKIEALTKWPPSYRWMHPCTAGIVTQRNCGHCKKCIRDLTVLYALGQLEKYKKIFDIEDYRKHLSERIAFVLARNDSDSNTETKQLLKERNVFVPKAAYIYAEQFSRAMKNLEASESGETGSC